MTTPALPQARTDRQPNEVIDNDDINLVATVANRADTTARNAEQTAAAALAEAEAAYVLPPGGVDPADMPVGTIIARLPTAQGFQPRPTSSLDVIYDWTRRSINDPVVPIGTVNGQLYAISGHDYVTQPPA